VLRRLIVALVVLCALAFPGRALACSHDDTSYYETFLDTSCLQLPLTNTTLDALGGLRLATNGTPSTSIWDTDLDFNNGVNYQTTVFPPVGVSTLQTTGTGSAAALTLPSTPLPLTADPADPVLGPTASTVGDGDNVDDPTVVKVGTTYDMWYTGYAEDGGAPEIFLATSTDGVNWTRANGGNPVLQGTAGAFDANGVFGADVVYDPLDPFFPYKMWYSGRSGVFGGIGYATSTDGLTWAKYTGGGSLPVPVLDHGLAGSADSFSAADPSVLKDGSTWKMWYTGDDSSKKRIAYATSPDGVTWSKGGKVIAPEDPGVSANIQFGAFAPTVWKTTSGYSMLLTGRKSVGGGVYQTKILFTTSTDGLAWAGPSPALNTSGTNKNFDYSNLNSPDLLYDPGTASPYKLYYSGNTIDANGNFHTRIGLATSTNGTSFNRVTGSQTGGSVLDVGTPGTAFDARQASGVSVAAPGGSGAKFVGFYWGTRGSDFMPRLGEATSPDGSTWTKVPVSAADGGALFGLGNPASFDNGGARDPSVLYDSGASAYDLYFTGLDSGGAASIGFSSTTTVGSGSNDPDNTSWSTATQVLAPSGSGFQSSGVSHPSVIWDGSQYVMYYTGTDSSGTPSIGRATSSSANGTFAAGASAVLSAGAAGTFDSTGVKDPVVEQVGPTDYRMLYTGVDADGIERVGYATSPDGSTWTKQGVVLNPSLTPFAADETGVEPTGMLVDGSTLHVWTSGIDRTGRTRGDHATTPFPTASGAIPSGWATYQLGDSSTTVEDFRQIARTSSGAVALSMSFLQPYSSGGSEYWSNYFPVTETSPSQALNFLLTVHGVRWRAQLTTPTSSPNLDTVQLTYAPVSFAPTGSASSGPVSAASGRSVTAWGSLVVNTSLFTPSGSGTGTGTVQVVDAASSAPLASATLNTGGTTTLSLTGISPSSHPAIRIVFNLQSDGQATPLVHSFTVSYTTETTPPTAALSVTPSSGVAPLAVTADASGSTQGATSISSYSFNWGDGTAGTGPQTAATATHTYASSGTYTVTVTVTDADGTTATAAQQVTVGPPPPPPTLTLAASRTKVVFGKAVTLSGLLSQSGAALAGQSVALGKQPLGASAFKQFSTLTTDTSGAYSKTSKPKKETVYEATATGAAPAPTVTVKVAQRLTLSVRRKGGKVYLKGRLAPKKRHRLIVILVKRGKRWKRLARVRTSKRSTFKSVRVLKRGHVYKFRAKTRGYRGLLAGTSRIVRLKK
jgi:predicted GH43/DUF377 family glycosyl hydrolase